jgi:glycosidase
MIKLASTVSIAAMLAMACTNAGSKQADVSALTQDYSPAPYIELEHAEWTRDAVIYQLNTRQFTREGTFKAALEQLPRLADMGVDIIWLMPIHPIGKENRKGSLGSPYSVRDYFGVNPEFGTEDDLRAFIDQAHELGLHVIIDWVANHTAWDNPLVEEHPDWYVRDWNGDFMPTPWWDWSDIIDLDYAQVGLREYMATAMKYWVEDFGVDGFRCDVAGYIPVDFWEDVRAELETVKPVFMLAEAERRDLHARSFDATYGWSWNAPMEAIAQGKADATALYGYYSENESGWPHNAMRMLGTSNHDFNSWHGHQFERLGDGLQSAIILSFVGEGMPLIYNGQEAGLDKRLEFFERDPIVWREHELDQLFRSLIALKTEERALWNGDAGGRMVPISSNQPQQLFSFSREVGESKIVALMNMSGEAVETTLTDGPYAGIYRDAFTGQVVELAPGAAVSLGPWENLILRR